MPLDMESYMQACSQETSPRVVAAVTDGLLMKSEEDGPWMCPIALAKVCSLVEQEQGEEQMAKEATEELKEAQEKDPVLRRVQEYVMTDHWPKLMRRDRDKEVTVLYRQRSKLYLDEEGILYNSDQKENKLQPKRKRHTRQVNMVAEEDSGDENDWRCLRSLSTKQLAESTSRLGSEEEELQLTEMEEERDEGKRNSGIVADVMGDENEMTEAGEETSSDEVDEGGPAVTHLSQRKYPFRQRHPPTIFTYDTLGKPSIAQRVM
ncbi:hypothetical protein Q7C36_012534 [Tachysurus vachellii]|uniref:Uncharacterized protein n=1 Tax=Tachysurus vachellii TaxID=175792 RepID=A0AA88MLE2_TACVA|nr:hypothetical protein Q7C36_012534 [Tachysurus vachellii]